MKFGSLTRTRRPPDASVTPSYWGERSSRSSSNTAPDSGATRSKRLLKCERTSRPNPRCRPARRCRHAHLPSHRCWPRLARSRGPRRTRRARLRKQRRTPGRGASAKPTTCHGVVRAALEIGGRRGAGTGATGWGCAWGGVRRGARTFLRVAPKKTPRAAWRGLAAQPGSMTHCRPSSVKKQ